MDEDRMKAWQNFMLAHAVIFGQLEAELIAGVGLSMAWYEALLRLHYSPEGRLRMSDLADSLVIAQSSVTRLIDRMERAGLVCREANLSDRRVTYVAMTARGREAFARARPVHLDGVAEHFTQHLDPHEAETLRTIMRRILEANGRGEGQIRNVRPRGTSARANDGARSDTGGARDRAPGSPIRRRRNR
jgi:DNA-binding MarR family transcriptional regulator